MKERTISFNEEMVRAIRAGTKTQTRRPIKKQPPSDVDYAIVGEDGDKSLFISKNAGGEFYRGEDAYRKSPYGVVGDRLLVRGSNITLESIGVYAERLHDITRPDIISEGIEPAGCSCDDCCVDAFSDLWNDIYAGSDFGWDVNPWVWVYEFVLIYDGRVMNDHTEPKEDVREAVCLETLKHVRAGRFSKVTSVQLFDLLQWINENGMII